MGNLRDVVDRIVSGFFYTPPHSPPCARGTNVVSEYSRSRWCFVRPVDTTLSLSLQQRSRLHLKAPVTQCTHAYTRIHDNVVHAPTVLATGLRLVLPGND